MLVSDFSCNNVVETKKASNSSNLSHDKAPFLLNFTNGIR